VNWARFREKSRAKTGFSNLHKAHDPAAVASDQPHLTARERYRRNWLLRLASLPRPLYNSVSDRLVRGQSAISVAHFLMQHPNRGGLSNVGYWTLQKYVNVLKEVIDERKRANPGATMEELDAEMGKLLQLVPAAPPLPSRKPGDKFKSVTEYVDDLIRDFNEEVFLIGVIKSGWEALERMRCSEEILGEDSAVPLHSFAAGRAQASHVIIAAADGVRRQKDSKVVRQKIMTALGEDLGGLIPTLNGGQFGQNQSDQKQTKEEETNPYAEMSETDRILARSVTEKLITYARLKKLKDEQQSRPATGHNSAATLDG